MTPSRTRLVVAALVLAVVARAGPAHATIEEALTADPFGKVVLYRESTKPARVLVLLSDERGWQRDAVEAARALAGLDALVIGIDLPRYLGVTANRGGELYPSADLEVVSQLVQKKVRLPAYRAPVVIGYGTGAAMAYAVAAQARPTTFAGAVSLGFCPTLELPKPLGADNALTTVAEDHHYRLQPAASLATAWVAFQGRAASGCDPDVARRFIAAVGGARLVAIDGGEPVAADPEHWLPRMRETLDRLTGTAAAARSSPAVTDGGGTDGGAPTDLPLIEIPARGPQAGTLAVVLSGDGGWASLDREVGEALADAGVGVVGWNSLTYFWTKRTPDGTAADLIRVLRHYRDAWQASRVLLIGYSRGADVLPFLARRLPADLRRDVALVALLGPGRSTDFEFHLSDWIGGDERTALPVRPEVDALGTLRVLCVQGDAEADSLCPTLTADTVHRVVLPGGHHFGGDYGVIAARILAEAGIAAQR